MPFTSWLRMVRIFLPANRPAKSRQRVSSWHPMVRYDRRPRATSSAWHGPPITKVRSSRQPKRSRMKSVTIMSVSPTIPFTADTTFFSLMSTVMPSSVWSR